MHLTGRVVLIICRELWREEARLDSVIQNTRQEFDRAERFLSHMMDQNTSRGIASVRRIKQQHNLEGVYGTLAELFDVPDKFKTAVEVTGGTSLFHYVVDNDETASRVLEILQKEKVGRVTFMPLNRLRPRSVPMPKANDAIEMITRLNFDAKYTKAFQQVFGKTIICPNLEIAAQYARSHGVSAITPDGDRSDKKGALSGGYYDPRSSRIDGVQALSKWRNELEQQRSKMEQIRRGLEAKDQEVTRAVGDLQKAEQRRQQLENSYEPLQRELRAKITDLQTKQDALDAKRRAKENVEEATGELAEQQESYEKELASEFKKALTTAEEKSLDELNASLPDLRKQHMQLSSSRAELEAQKSTFDVELRENLRPRLDQINNHAFEESSAGVTSKLADRQKDLKRASKAARAVETKLQEAETNIDKANAELTSLEQQRNAKQQELEELAKGIERFQKKMERSMAKRSLLTEKATEASRNIRDLGVLPEEAFDKYTRVSSEKVNFNIGPIAEGTPLTLFPTGHQTPPRRE